MTNKPCPFCGKEVEVIPWRDEENEGLMVHCNGNEVEEGCDIYFQLPEWNNRPIEDALLAALQHLGSKPDGYCFCFGDTPSGDHTGECREAQQAIAKAEGVE